MSNVISAFNFPRVTSEIQVNLHRHTRVKLVVIDTLNYISRIRFGIVFYVIAALTFCFNVRIHELKVASNFPRIMSTQTNRDAQF